MTYNNGKVRCAKKKGTSNKEIKKHVYKWSTMKTRSSRKTCAKRNSKKSQTVISRKRKSPRRSSSLNKDNYKRVLRNKKTFSSIKLVNNCNIIYIIRHAHIISDKHFTCILAVKPIALTLIYNR